MHRLLRISRAVKEALKERQPIVALESTIIAHGMPYPTNLQCGVSLESLIMKEGAIPATIAVFDGFIHVGLSALELQQLAQMPALKVSRRDLPYVMSSRQRGATTVAATMLIAQMAGIEVFVTGGVGGVHRGAEVTMDISADLRELGRTPVSVVCAGVKSILDIQKTLEYLETEGVPVVTYRSKTFPAFYSDKSLSKSPITLHETSEIASLIYYQRQLQLNTGVLIAVPNDQPLEGDQIEEFIQTALKEAEEASIKGAEITPYLLKRVNEISEGKSLKANLALIHHNARIGAAIAKSLNALYNEGQDIKNSKVTEFVFETLNNKEEKEIAVESNLRRKEENERNALMSSAENIVNEKKEENEKLYKGEGAKQSEKRAMDKEVGEMNPLPIIVIGCSAIDYQYRGRNGFAFEPYRSCQTDCKISYGGVARNIAEVCSRLSLKPTLLTALGSDGAEIERHIRGLGINLKSILTPSFLTSRHISAMDSNNDEYLGMSEMNINSLITFDALYSTHFQHLRNHRGLVIIDANVANEDSRQLLKILQYLKHFEYTVIFECKGQKSIKILHEFAYNYVDMIKMNKIEYDLLVEEMKGSTDWIKDVGKEFTASKESDDKRNKKSIGREFEVCKEEENTKAVDEEEKHKKIRMPKVIITNGKENIKYEKDNEIEEMKVLQSDMIKKTTGAGDAFTGAFVSCIACGGTIKEALRWGTVASKITIETETELTHFSSSLSLSRLLALHNKHYSSHSHLSL